MLRENKFYLKLFAIEAVAMLFVGGPLWIFITVKTASYVFAPLALVVKENSRKPLAANIAKVFGTLVFCKAIEVSSIKFIEFYIVKFFVNLVTYILHKSKIYRIYSCKCRPDCKYLQT